MTSPAHLLLALAPLQSPSPELSVRGATTADLLDNGDFELAPEALADDPGGPAPARIPWWTPMLVSGDEASAWDQAERGWIEVGTLLAGRSEGGALPRVEGGELLLDGGPELLMTQPIAAAAGDGWVRGFEVSGKVRGQGILVVRDGAGRVWRRGVGGEGQDSHSFHWVLGDEDMFGVESRPRMLLGVASAGQGVAAFDDLRVTSHLPLVDIEGDGGFAVELEALALRTLDQLHEGGRDRFGPRESAFWVGLHDVDTGAFRGGGGRGGEVRPIGRVGLSSLDPIYLDLVALGVGGDEVRARFEAHTTELLGSCIHPGTGLPRRYDPVADQPMDHEPLQVAAYLEHLINLANGGIEPGSGEPARQDLLPAELHAAAFEAAVKMGAFLVEVGVQPDGSVAALLRPADGWASTSVVHLRRLDVPAQLVRLAAMLRDRGLEPELQAALVAAAREAVLEVEYANLWPGTWRTIDPGFDDTFGHLGERSIAMATAWPEEPAFARLVRTGREHFARLWRQALMHGGNVAADQVRCWRILAELDELDRRLGLEPFTIDGMDTAELLMAAARNHFKGEQTTAGSWLDVTIVGHGPATNLPVGDIIGLPQNLFVGLATVRRHRSHQHERDEATLLLDAMFTTALVSTIETYGAPHGFAGGDRSSSGSIRILGGLVAMLAELRRP